MHKLRRVALAGVLTFLLSSGSLAAQGVDRARPSLLREVVPEADRFEDADGSPPVRRAYRGDELLAYVFLTSDLPPEVFGYSGPIEALVGMTPDGTLTGVRVTSYHETYMRTRGDFLRRPGFQEQFTGKSVGDAFRVGRDLDGISRVSISVRSLARGVRQAARKVAAEYMSVAERPQGPVENVLDLSWYEMRAQGVAERFEVHVPERDDPLGVSLLHLESRELAEYLMGGLYGYAERAADEHEGDESLVLYVVDGERPELDLQDGWSVVQDGVETPLAAEDVEMLGAPWEGLLYQETSMVGVLMLPGEVDMARPMTFLFDGAEELGSHTVAYTSQMALAAMAEEADAEVASAAAADAPAGAPASPAVAPEVVDATDEAVASPSTETRPSVSAQGAPAAAPAVRMDDEDLFLEEADEGGSVARMFADASWRRVGWIAIALSLATLAFLVKREAIRWVALAFTFVVLGYVDGGFLSVSHITAAIWVGPSVFLNDLPLLLMVTFTLVTVVLWGRIFCGYLCPFGALQDFIDRIVPDRFKRELPKRAHRSALKAKYVVLAIIVVPALAGSEASLYQYFEPFGTVFSLSHNLLLWGIAGSILLASARIPRFYCRYACPLGASLALASLLTLRRIRRVEQCDYCKVCERKCPTGAIEGPSIDFKECVRCNICEIELIERTGVCRHDMEAIRPRLVQIKAQSAVGLSEVAPRPDVR